MSEVHQPLVNMIKAGIQAKTFSTGSKGFYASGKIAVGDDRYQASAMAVLIGSKDNPKAKVTATADEITAALASLVQAGVPACQFKSGKTGYRTQGKAEARGQRFQVSIQAVRIG